MSLYLSASSISDYIKCPQRFLYRLKKSNESEQTIPMSIGNIIHKLLEISDTWDTDEDGIKLASLYLDEYGLAGYDVEKLRVYIHNFNVYYRALLSNDDLVEQKFKLPLGKDVFLVGKFDRILLKTNSVIDWKTSSRPPSNIDNDVQFIIYNESYKEIYGNYPSSVLFASLVQSKLIPYRRVDAFVNTLYNEIIPRIIYDYKKGSFYHLGLYNNACSVCAYKTYCFDQLGYKKYELDS